ncbi:SEC-C domain-containing protein [Bacillus cereus]|uniref:SEC-C domain-containing protein n=1 Tax=Bacillus cereus TaxID=1396 RepID=UPI00119C9492|nr:SEC-C domain-containing protein [Bacillus cereus]
MKRRTYNRNNVTTEKQYLKMLKNITKEPLRKSEEDGEKDDYAFVLKNGFCNSVEYSPKNYLLFDGLKSSGFCPCRSNLKFKHCCEQRVELLVESLLQAKYMGSLETTKDTTKLPIGFRLSPVFQINTTLVEKDTHLLKEIIRTHPTIVDHLYLISARNLAMASAKSPYARYHYDLMVSFEEDTPFDFKKNIDGDTPLNESEIERYVYGKTAVPSSRHHMREDSVRILSTDTFVLE